MAYNLPTNGIVEFRIVGLLHGQETVNTFHYQPQAAVVDARPYIAGALEEFGASVYNGIRAFQSVEWTCRYISGQYIWPQRYQPVIGVPASTTGAVSGQCCPSGVAYVLRRKAERATRRDQGRIYVPGVPVAGENDSRVAAITLSGLREMWGFAGTTSLEVVGYEPVLEPVIFNLNNPGIGVKVVNTDVNEVLCYQRRREVGRGS